MNPCVTYTGRKAVQTTSYILLPIISGVLMPATGAIAQVVSAEDGTNTTVTVVGDQFDITGGQHSSDHTNVFQSFERFDLGAEHTANFVTDANVRNVVGRVNAEQTSIINGTLQVSGSDANLYLMNPSGVLLGPDAQLNLSGGFTATTATGLGFNTDQFSNTTNDYSNLSGEPTTFHFETERPGAVVNLGDLSVEAGQSITLIGGTVVNTGELNAPSGIITVAAIEGESTVRISQAEQLLSLEVEANGITPTDHSAITATTIGEMLTGGELTNATTLITNADGSVRLSNTTDAIAESGGVAIASGTLSTTSDLDSNGGNINVLGSQISLTRATLDSSGSHGGGLIRVGGDYQGRGPVFNATRTTVDEFSTLSVNALEHGDGGRAITWADNTTRFHGQILGTGGTQDGNGGFAEISGKEHLTFTGLVDLSAPQGSLGNLLLDPNNIFITDGGPEQSIGGNDYIPSTTLENQAANIRLEANNNIVIEDLLDNELTLRSGGSATFIADANNFSGGEFIMRDLADVIRGEQKEISIAGAGITVGIIDTSTDEHNSGGGTITDLGNVTLTSSQGVKAEAIYTYGELSSPPHHSWDGGNVTIRAANGDINIAQSILTYSEVEAFSSGSEAGNAGDITLEANNGNIRIGTAGPTPTENVLQATSYAAEDESGQGGNISLIATDGRVEVVGNIAAHSHVGGKDAGDGGNVVIQANTNINITGTVDTSSVAGEDETGNGGSITMTADVINIGDVDTRASDDDDDAGNAGIVTLRGDSLLMVGSILATSTDGGDANITLTSDQVELTGGVNSVNGDIVNFIPASNTRDISVGANNGVGFLNIDTAAINAISSDVNTINIGHLTATGEGRLTIDQSVVDNANSRPGISIRNVESLIGPTPTDTGSTTTFRIGGAGTGRIENGNIQFANVFELQGGSGNDIFQPDAAVDINSFDRIEGGGGFNTISYESFSGSSLSVELENLFIKDIQRVIASNSSDNTLIGSNTNNLWTVDGSLGVNSGTLNGAVFENFNNLIGGTADDRFSFIDGGVITGQLSGGSGSNTLNYSIYGSPIAVDLATQTATGILAGFSDIESIAGSNNNSDVLSGSNNNNTFQIDSNGNGRVTDTVSLLTVDFSDIERIDGQGGNNTLQGLTGANSWTINGINSGAINGNAFENFSNITGGNGPNVFDFEDEGAIAGSLQGNTGIDQLNYSNYNRPIVINLERMAATGTSSFSSIEEIVGSTAADTLIGTDIDETFRITGAQAGTVSNGVNGDIQFSEIERVNGGLGTNTFILEGLTAPSGIVIEGGSDLGNAQSNNLLRSNGSNTVWRLDGRNQGSLQENNITLARFREIQDLANTSVNVSENTVRFEQPTAQISGSVSSGNSDLVLAGEDINVGEADGTGNNHNGTISGSGRLTIRPNNNSTGISLGGVDSQAPSTLSITASELAAIQDGFIEITIGGDTQTGGIALSGDAAFRGPVSLRSQADIDTRGGELRTDNGQLSIETEGAILSADLVSENRNVVLSAGEDITIDAVTAGGGSGIDATSNNGSITVNGTTDTSHGTTGNDVFLSANTDIRVGDIITSGSERSGDVTMRATLGAIVTGNITTANNIVVNGITQQNAGNVSLSSPGNIQVASIDARGNGLNTEASAINIITEGTFQATGTIDNPELSSLITGIPLAGGASISTVGALDGSVRIEYGRSDTAAVPFAVGNSNGSTLRIETPQTAILSGDFLGSYEQANIALVNRGIVPPTVLEPANVSRVSFAGADTLPVSFDLNFVADNNADDIFTQIETRNGRAFGEHLGIGDTPIVSRQTVQNALKTIKQNTDTTPALLYVYFVADAASELAVESTQAANANPDDQLEIMLITDNGDPIQRRQWGITRAQVEEANQQLRQQATSQFSTAQQYLSPAQQLYDWIVRPVAETLQQQNVTSLGVVMDGGLRTMPIATLHNGESFLVERYSLGVLPSFSLANIHSTVSAERIDYRQERILAMGASEFKNQPSLPAVSAELEIITQELGAGDAFLNEAFVLENLQSQLRQEDYGIVHLATHAVFEPGNIERSYIQLWDEQLSLNQLNDLRLSEEEISLIILSACSTALGDHTAEYGFAGLAVNAGSQAALASIWPVSDEGTLGFMAQFYQELRGTTVRTEALRQTQIQMLRGEVGITDGMVYGPNNETLAHLPTLAESGRWDFSHPFYWSPFTMIGNPW